MLKISRTFADNEPLGSNNFKVGRLMTNKMTTFKICALLGTALSMFGCNQARFGPDIIFPAQQVFPKQYEAARAQGANGQAALKSTLASGTYKALKTKE